MNKEYTWEQFVNMTTIKPYNDIWCLSDVANAVKQIPDVRCAKNTKPTDYLRQRRTIVFLNTATINHGMLNTISEMTNNVSVNISEIQYGVLYTVNGGSARGTYGVEEVAKHYYHYITSTTRCQKLACSHLYIVETAGYIKIGITSNVEKRIRTMQVGCPSAIELRLLYEGDVNEAERIIHYKLRGYNVHGEWFRVDFNIEDYIASLKLDIYPVVHNIVSNVWSNVRLQNRCS